MYTYELGGRRVWPLTLVTVCPPGAATTLTWDLPGHQSRRYRLGGRTAQSVERLWSGWTLTRHHVIEPLRTMPRRHGIRAGQLGYQLARPVRVVTVVALPGDREPDCQVLKPTAKLSPQPLTDRDMAFDYTHNHSRRFNRYVRYLYRLAAYQEQR